MIFFASRFFVSSAKIFLPTALAEQITHRVKEQSILGIIPGGKMPNIVIWLRIRVSIIKMELEANNFTTMSDKRRNLQKWGKTKRK